MNFDLSEEEKQILRSSLNGLTAQMNVSTARVFLSMVDKVNAILDLPELQPATLAEQNAFRDNIPVQAGNGALAHG